MDDEMYDPSAGIEESDLEDDGTLDASDTLDGDPGDDPLDQGIVPPDRWSAGEGFGTTLAEEGPDTDPYAESGAASDGDLPIDGPLADDEQEPRAGRLVAQDEGAHPDREPDLVARDARM